MKKSSLVLIFSVLCLSGCGRSKDPLEWKIDMSEANHTIEEIVTSELLPLDQCVKLKAVQWSSLAIEEMYGEKVDLEKLTIGQAVMFQDNIYAWHLANKEKFKSQAVKNRKSIEAYWEHEYTDSSGDVTFLIKIKNALPKNVENYSVLMEFYETADASGKNIGEVRVDNTDLGILGPGQTHRKWVVIKNVGQNWVKKIKAASKSVLLLKFEGQPEIPSLQEVAGDLPIFTL